MKKNSDNKKELNSIVKEIDPIVQEMIERYKKLNLGNGVTCPYYMNLKRSKDLRAMVGKGTPEEIELEAKMWEKLKGVNFSEMAEQEIRDFLMNRGIGIDCSGFVIHVLDPYFKLTTGKHIWNFLKIPNKSFLAKISYRLKPVEKLGAEIITNDENSEPVEIKDVVPGDVIRTKWKKKNSHHILLVTKVEYDKAGKVKLIEYTHSIPQYGNSSGVKTGQIEITDMKKPLHEQKWLEVDEAGVNHVFEGFMIQLEDNGIRRIKQINK